MADRDRSLEKATKNRGRPLSASTPLTHPRSPCTHPVGDGKSGVGGGEWSIFFYCTTLISGTIAAILGTHLGHFQSRATLQMRSESAIKARLFYALDSVI